jgi:hypothetical protein
MTVEAQLRLLLATLAGGPRTATELKQALGGISPATLSRLMGRLGHRPWSGEELSFVTYKPPPIISARQDLVDTARRQATRFWQLVADDVRLTHPFRSLCSANLSALLKSGAGLRVVG